MTCFWLSDCCASSEPLLIAVGSGCCGLSVDTGFRYRKRFGDTGGCGLLFEGGVSSEARLRVGSGGLFLGEVSGSDIFLCGGTGGGALVGMESRFIIGLGCRGNRRVCHSVDPSSMGGGRGLRLGEEGPR